MQSALLALLLFYGVSNAAPRFADEVSADNHGNRVYRDYPGMEYHLYSPEYHDYNAITGYTPPEQVGSTIGQVISLGPNILKATSKWLSNLADIGTKVDPSVGRALNQGADVLDRAEDQYPPNLPTLIKEGLRESVVLVANARVEVKNKLENVQHEIYGRGPTHPAFVDMSYYVDYWRLIIKGLYGIANGLDKPKADP